VEETQGEGYDIDQEGGISQVDIAQWTVWEGESQRGRTRGRIDCDREIYGRQEIVINVINFLN
jgi:hypothetical protein